MSKTAKPLSVSRKISSLFMFAIIQEIIPRKFSLYPVALLIIRSFSPRSISESL